MRLDHLNLSVADVSGNRTFFETYFGFRCMADRGETLTVLTDETGFILTLSNFSKESEYTYPPAFHVGFSQASRERVDEIHARLTADGWGPKTRREFHGAWTFYIKAPGGFLVEVFHQHQAR